MSTPGVHNTHYIHHALGGVVVDGLYCRDWGLAWATDHSHRVADPGGLGGFNPLIFFHFASQLENS